MCGYVWKTHFSETCIIFRGVCDTPAYIIFSGQYNTPAKVSIDEFVILWILNFVVVNELLRNPFFNEVLVWN